MNTFIHVLPGACSLASLPMLSPEAKKRLKWMDYHRKHKNASQTCRYFGISRKTFYVWKKRYNPYHLESLEEQSRRPKNTRQWEVSRIQEFRIIALKKRYILTGIDCHSKIAFARMYTTKNSKNAKDFLLRMNYLLDNKIENITRDNG
ncbi:helix-turn-helix domain-containing protein [Patescibacteria group bacterium]|nr:helix-turn-helix domain-containing protein [Patescibacteria group bacterium]